MTKDINYPQYVGCYVTIEQADKIKKSGMSQSEFLRNAIDFYDETRLQSYTIQKIRHIDECISTLKVYQQNLKNEHYNTLKFKPENLKGDGETGNVVYKENTETLKETSENLKTVENLKGETLKKSSENLKGAENEKTDNDWETIQDTVIRLIANKGHLTNDDYSFQAGRIGKTTAELKKYVAKNLEFLEKEADKYR